MDRWTGKYMCRFVQVCAGTWETVQCHMVKDVEMDGNSSIGRKEGRVRRADDWTDRASRRWRRVEEEEEVALSHLE